MVLAVEKFFCAPLETGGYIIGVLDMIGGILLMILGIFCTFADSMIKFSFSYPKDKEREVLITFGIFIIALGIFELVIGVLLIVAVKQQSHVKMLIVIIVTIVNLIGDILNVFIDFPYGLISFLIITPFQIYFLICLISLYERFR